MRKSDVQARQKPQPPSEESIRSELKAALAAYGLPDHIAIPSEDRVLQAMRDLTRELRRPPESSEIAERAKITGGDVSRHIRKLYEKGKILRLPMGSSSIRAKWIPAAE